MGKYDLKNFTYGCELEIADIDTRKILPEKIGFNYNYVDYSIANSNGIANDPLKKWTCFGSEINTEGTDSIDSQLNIIKDAYSFFHDKISFNYTCNLHVHIGVPDLRDDVVMLKRIASYIYDYSPYVFKCLDPIPAPNIYLDNNDASFYERKRFNQRKRSHHKIVGKRTYKEMMEAATPNEFYMAHAPVSSRPGKRIFAWAPRASINMQQLFNGAASTVEFKHFQMSFDFHKMYSAIKWCEQFIYHAIHTGEHPIVIFKDYPNLSFQKFHDYDYEIDKFFRRTCLTYMKKRSVVINNINEIKKENPLLELF